MCPSANADWHLVLAKDLPDCTYEKGVTAKGLVRSFLHRFPNAKCDEHVFIRKKIRTPHVFCESKHTAISMLFFESFRRCNITRNNILEFDKTGGDK